jgi:hypothetical protein
MTVKIDASKGINQVIAENPREVIAKEQEPRVKSGSNYGR